MNNQHSIFRPWVTVWDSGRIEVDFSDSFEGSYDDGPDEIGDLGVSDAHGRILDEVIGATDRLTPSQNLRRLADYLDAQP